MLRVPNQTPTNHRQQCLHQKLGCLKPTAGGYRVRPRFQVTWYTEAVQHDSVTECKGNYSATSNNVKLVHWPLMGGIWYSEEVTGRGRSRPSPLVAVPNVTALPSTVSVPVTVLLYSPAASPYYASCACSIRRSTSQAVLLSLVVSLVLSRLDYGNATLAGLPGNQIDRLQSVMNAAARLVCSAQKYEHITPLLRDLHWLRVPERIQFKLSVLVFRCLHGTAPPYGERATSCGGRGYKKAAAIFVDVCPLSHHLCVVRRLVTARSSSLRCVPGTLCHPASLRLRHSAPSSVV